MDETVSVTVNRIVLSTLLACASAVAQPLQDPTRPPANLLARQAGEGSAATAAAPARGPQLQSVLIARHPGGRHVAVIDGETLRLGELYKGARVTRIEQHAVELMRGRTRQVLTLHAPGARGIERVPNK
jgi:MSHA biogenesis protein MshK